ncbi:MAG: lipase family protein [Flavipsychrobacter sp.]|jgi:hypothetical protein|nr:lipase family protein [Flavipsychrobacter sp.]
MKTAINLLFILLALSSPVYAQVLKPGFDTDEYIGVLQRCSMQFSKNLRGDLPKETNFEKVYQSPNMGLHNKWDLWVNKEKTIMTVNLRGTTSDVDSWLENFYSAMIPATGSLKLDGITPTEYKFANDPKAKVHVGWTVGICSMLPDILEKVKLWYGKGIKQLIIEGHSQGGALSYLLSSYLHYQVADRKLPNDLIIKTYCSAAPKPGNLYYAYDYDNFNRAGWAFNVVNSADWVPEMPITIQTQHDINKNPYDYTKESLKKQNFIVRYYINHIYHKMDRLTRRAQRKYEKFLGRVIYKQVRKHMEDLEQPKYAGSTNYSRAGMPIVLMPDESYHQKFPDTSRNIFHHHLFDRYYFLVMKAYK